MKSVAISELKAKLARYVKEAQRGGEIQVTDRGEPVAMLVPIRAIDPEAFDARVERLAAAGALRRGQTGGAIYLRDHPPLDFAGANLSGAISEEREDRV